MKKLALILLFTIYYSLFPTIAQAQPPVFATPLPGEWVLGEHCTKKNDMRVRDLGYGYTTIGGDLIIRYRYMVRSPGFDGNTGYLTGSWIITWDNGAELIAQRRGGIDPGNGVYITPPLTSPAGPFNGDGVYYLWNFMFDTEPANFTLNYTCPNWPNCEPLTNYLGPSTDDGYYNWELNQNAGPIDGVFTLNWDNGAVIQNINYDSNDYPVTDGPGVVYDFTSNPQFNIMFQFDIVPTNFSLSYTCLPPRTNSPTPQTLIYLPLIIK